MRKILVVGLVCSVVLLAGCSSSFAESATQKLSDPTLLGVRPLGPCKNGFLIGATYVTNGGEQYLEVLDVRTKRVIIRAFTHSGEDAPYKIEVYDGDSVVVFDSWEETQNKYPDPCALLNGVVRGEFTKRETVT